jgi:hypothetical protein
MQSLTTLSVSLRLYRLSLTAAHHGLDRNPQHDPSGRCSQHVPRGRCPLSQVHPESRRSLARLFHDRSRYRLSLHAATGFCAQRMELLYVKRRWHTTTRVLTGNCSGLAKPRIPDFPASARHRIDRKSWHRWHSPRPGLLHRVEEIVVRRRRRYARAASRSWSSGTNVRKTGPSTVESTIAHQIQPNAPQSKYAAPLNLPLL